MIEVLLSWIFIAITSYVIGYKLQELLYRMLAGADTDIYIRTTHLHVLRCLIGLCVVNVYAETISIFTGVGMWADYILLFVCLLIVFVDKDHLGRTIDIASAVKSHPGKSAVYLVLIILMAFGTSRGYMHVDTNLYHAQAIHWIEDYGVVPGLAVIQSRFGYNSAEFALNALYGFKWLIGRSLHTSAGFFALLSSYVVVGVTDAFSEEFGKKGFRPRVSDYVRIGLIFYLGLIFSEMISPASDYYAQLLLFDIVIMWLDSVHIENEKVMSIDISTIQGVLSILIVYAATVKLSLVPLVLLALIPGIKWIHDRKYKNIVTCILCGLVIAIPYFVRGYFISGWILYPSTLIGIGNPDWRIPRGMAQYDAREIGMWGRGIYRAEDWSTVTALNWFPRYILRLSFMERVWLLTSLISMIFVLLLFVVLIIQKNKDRIQQCAQYLCFFSVLCLSAIVWFVSAPLIRYGYAYIIIIPIFTVGFLVMYAEICGIKCDRVKLVPFITIAIFVCVLKVKGLVVDIMHTVGEEYYIEQQDYIDGDAFTYTVNDTIFYVAEDSGQIGYYKYPSTVEERHDFMLRGTDIEDGFRLVETEGVKSSKGIY